MTSLHTKISGTHCARLTVASMVTVTTLVCARQDYNLKLGPLEFDAIGRAGLEFNDNIGTSEFNADSDVISYVGVDFRSIWEITEYNDLNINFGAYYRKYFNNSDLDSHNNFLTLTPDTEISFRALIGNLSLNFYDRLNFSVDGTDIITPSGQTDINDYSRLNNSFGVDADWDLNAAQLSLSVGRHDVIPMESSFDFTRRRTYFVSPSIRKTFNKSVVAGFGGTWSDTGYPEDDFQNESIDLSYGPFVNFIVSDVLDFTASVNVHTGRFSDPDPNPNSGNNRDFSDLDSYSMNLQMNHALNDNYIHGVAYRRSIDLGLISNYVTSEVLEYTFTFSGFRRSDIDGGVYWGTGRDSNAQGLPGSLGEDYDRFGARVGMGYAINPKTRISTQYNYSQKDSDTLNRSYERNVLDFSLSYDF